MFMRFLFTCLLIYLGYRFIKALIPRDSTKEEVKGTPKSGTLDLKKEDVADATFEDIQDS